MAFRFLDLPPELRNQIYFHTFARADVNKRYENARTQKFPIDDRDRHITGINLLFANKQVHDEAVAILFEITPFHVTGDFQLFLDKIGRINASRIRHLILYQTGLGMVKWVRRDPSPEELRRRTEIHEQGVNNRKLISATCTGLKTIEILDFDIGPTYVLVNGEEKQDHIAWVQETIGPFLPNLRRSFIEAIPTLQCTTITFQRKNAKAYPQLFVDILRVAKSQGWSIKQQIVDSSANFAYWALYDSGFEDPDDPPQIVLLESEQILDLDRMLEEIELETENKRNEAEAYHSDDSEATVSPSFELLEI